MPLIIGDWLKGTRGMKANVKGVYVGLLLHQWDHGFIPDDLEELTLIEPEVGSVWVSLSDKFPLVSPGRRQNSKCEEVRRFFKKQRKNGEKGGRPKKNNPTDIPKETQKETQSRNPPFGLGLDIGSDNEIKDRGVGKGESDFTQPDVQGDELFFPTDTRKVREIWAQWKRYRWEAHGSRYPMMGEQADLKRLEGLTEGQIEETILTAIANNWKNLYPQRNGKSATTPSVSRKQAEADARKRYLQDHYSARLGEK